MFSKWKISKICCNFKSLTRAANVIHSYVVNNIGHKLKLLAALLSIWENPLAGNVNLKKTG